MSLVAQTWSSNWLGPEGLTSAAWVILASAAISAALVLFLIPPLKRLAWWSGYLDHPEARKLHTQATPLLGGLGVAIATIVGCVVGFNVLSLSFPTTAVWWLAGAAGALALGLYDDRFGMKPGPKLVLQFGVGLLFMGGGVYPKAFGEILSFPLSLFWLVGIMNATNFLDNMDGIVGGLASILSAGLGFLLMSWGYSAEAIYAFALSAASLAFLRFNFFPATVFLGDAGSLFVGYSLGALSLLAAHAGPGIQSSAAALLILGYLVFDLTFVVITRIREGRKIYHGGKDHTTHRLSRLVRGPRRTTLWLYFFAAALTWTGVALANADGFPQVVLWLSVWTFWLVLLGLRLARIPSS